MSVSGLNQQYLPNTLDGLNIVEADQVYIDGQLVNLSDYVPYENATRTLNMGAQNIQTTHNATTGNDVVNKTHLDNVVSNLSIAIAGSFLDKVTLTPQTVIGNVSYTAQLSADDLLVPATKKATLGSVLSIDANYTTPATDAGVITRQYFGSITSSMGIYEATSTQNFAILQCADLGTGTGKRMDINWNLNINEPTYNSSIQLFSSSDGVTTNQYLGSSVSFTPSDPLYKVMTGSFVPQYRYLCILCITSKPGGVQTVRWYGLDIDEQGVELTNVSMPSLGANRVAVLNDKKQLVSSGISTTKLDYLDNVSSDIQTQLNGKLNLSGGTMTGDIVMGSNKVTSTATPTTDDTLTRKGYVDTQDNLRVLKSGDTMTGSLIMGAFKVTSSAIPVIPDDYTNKSYVDGAITGLGATYAKLAGPQTFTGTHTFSSATPINLSGLTASRVLQLDGSKNVQTSTVTTTELGYVSGVTSGLQGQIDGKASTSYVDTQDGLRVLKAGDTMTGQLSVYDETKDIDSRYTLNTFMRGWYNFHAGSETDLTYLNTSSGIVGAEIVRTDKYVWTRGPRIRLDRNKTYQAEFNIRRMNPTSTSGNAFFFVIQEWTWNGLNIGGDGTDWYYPVPGVAQSSLTTAQWVNYKASVGPNGGKAHASNAYYISVGFIVNYTNTVTTDIMEMTGFKLFPIENDIRAPITSSGLTSNGNVIINNALMNVAGGTPYAVPNGYMATGSLTIGGIAQNYGGGNNWTTNTAGLLMECLDNTEIGIHDAGTRIASFMYFQGGSTNTFTIGRDMGWGDTPLIINSRLQCNSNVGIGTTSPTGALHVYRNVNGGLNSYVQNVSGGSGAYALFGCVNNTGNGAVLFLNSNTRTDDGGVNTATLRNDAGDMRLQSTGGRGITIQGTTGACFHSAGDNSYMRYGPNATWGAYLHVGATTNKVGQAETAQVITTNGNLHLDAGYGRDTYINFYQNQVAQLGLIFSYGISWHHQGRMFINGNVGIGSDQNTNRLEVYSTTADYTNSVVIKTPWAGITLDNGQVAFGRKWGFFAGGPGAGIGTGNLGIFDITANRYCFNIEALGNVMLGTGYNAWTKVGVNGGITCNTSGGLWTQAGNAVLITQDAVNQGGQSNGLQIAFSANAGWITCLQPGIAWREFNIYASQYYFYTNGVLNVYLFPGIAGWITASDEREKEDIQDLKTDKSLKRIMALKPKHYRRKYYETETPVSDEIKQMRHVGFLAQEVQQSNPHCVSHFCNKEAKSEEDDGDRLGVNYNDLNIHLVGAVQEQQRMIDEQTKRIATLEAREVVWLEHAREQEAKMAKMQKDLEKMAGLVSQLISKQ